MDALHFSPLETDVGKRLDSYITENLEDISRNSVQKLIIDGNILVNKTVAKPNYKIRVNDGISLEMPELVELKIEPEPISLSIIYEDEQLIVIDKPQGMVVHPAAGHYNGTVVNGLLYHCGDQLSGINGIMRPGIVHRIDKDTSGILVVAKTNLAHQFLSQQLAEHTMTRKYYAVVYHNVKTDQGTIDQPIGRHPIDRKKMAVTLRNGKQAITHYKVLERFAKATLIQATLETGRTHQIRVHMSSIGHPLLGDTVYGIRKSNYHLNGQALHAKVLGFIHPTTGEYLEFNSPLPDYFLKLLKQLRNL